LQPRARSSEVGIIRHVCCTNGRRFADELANHRLGRIGMDGVLGLVNCNRTKHFRATDRSLARSMGRRQRGPRVANRKRVSREQPPTTPVRTEDTTWRPWEMLIALLIFAATYSLITKQLRLAPIWLLPSVIVVLLAALFVAHLSERRDVARWIAIALACIGAIAVLSSVVVLVVRLVRSDLSAPYLLRDAALLWIANVIVFGLWYWELDGGGPHYRHLHGYRPTDLAFPQTALGGGMTNGWEPDFIDYLFVAFNASTAFSPTDTSVLSARAKLLMMVQSLMSIVLLAVVAARAINVLH
jgi:uncharacterized membrane protein